ncbi:unnamed protein product [Acanthoscelides obtectus]|uniref:Uncharacterized protein n=1 Tax=Acanthoscelides obtectus TaxID=200917 RepID=A0A9P0JSA2_ACAOB|nr:unnamed protein product [Acanthoscelides obtectus]CAK1663818.1 hypothetical protein AOBTE_LOCUS23870 [Acanthoscelides obtectus]
MMEILKNHQLLISDAAVSPYHNVVRKSDRFNNGPTSTPTPLTPYQLVENLRKQITVKDEELEKAEQLNRSFEKLAQLISLLGQIDSFLTEKTKSLIRKVAAMADDSGREGISEQEFNSGTLNLM